MQFGRLPTLDGVSFAVPPLSARSERLLAASLLGDTDPTGAPWLRIGAPAWSRRDWLGKLYPKGTTARDWLRLYASQAGAIELNATFYALPDEATLDGWIEATPPAFRFCPKVPREVSHALGDAAAAGAQARFVERVRRLGGRLGPSLLQLSDGFPPSGLPVLEAALARFPDGFPLAVELRHPGWFTASGAREELLATLERRGAGTVITDVAGRRDACHGALTTPVAFVRWVGEAGHTSDGPRLEGWVDRLAAWRARGLRQAFLFVHQPDDVLAPEGMAVASSAARARGIEVPAISLVAGAAPARQLGLF